MCAVSLCDVIDGSLSHMFLYSTPLSVTMIGWRNEVERGERCKEHDDPVVSGLGPEP